MTSTLPALLLALVLLVLLAWAFARWRLQGPDQAAFDRPVAERFARADAPAAELQGVVASLAGVRVALDGVPLRGRNAVLRRYLDGLFADRGFAARFVPVDAGGVRGEWVLAAGADPARRLLYLHGGAFSVGSPRSHRTLTTQLAQRAGAVVLALDYRLMPEHRRRDGIDDCRRAYRWLLAHGPDGPAPAATVFVAGDSAGGNLTLALLAWARDAGLRAPDAAVALSPLTDATLGSPSMRRNVATDPMLGPLFGWMAKLPRWLLLWGSWAQTRIRPCDPLVSPLLGELSRLPPVLVQASEAEMLHDDAQRWVAKAQAAGSPARLQTWPQMVHVWQIFNPELSEARAALEQVGRFLDEVAPRRGLPAAAA